MAAPPAGLGPCHDRGTAHALIPLGGLPPPRCNARGFCAAAPGAPGVPAAPHAAGVHLVCDNCVNAADTHHTPTDDRSLQRLVVHNLANGTPAISVAPQGHRSRMCKFCEADELEQYLRNTTLGVPAPANAANGWLDSCICMATDIRGLRYCATCRPLAVRALLHRASLNQVELRNLARDARGHRVTSSGVLRGQRTFLNNPNACRCGRRPVKPTPNPTYTYCLACCGVQVDAPQLRFSRHNGRRIAAGGLRTLRNVSANFNLADRPPVSRNAVLLANRENNRK
ncbi:hypothetical protein LTR53_003892 [Teratosphaeriaceae sp. CCFEE 6253]|nr:hypothetical protein LTR53_003892 [Teratosphaeriaceae sp. CCFEE 6253]